MGRIHMCGERAQCKKCKKELRFPVGKIKQESAGLKELGRFK